MEAVAINTAKSALNSVLQIATKTIADEIGLLLGVQEELFFIKEELEMMRAFLRAASTERVKGEIVATWIKQVQELAFDVEDCLLEASVHLLKKPWLPVMCSVKKRDNIARKIQVLKSRIEDVSKRNLRYNLIHKEKGGHIDDESASMKLIANVGGLLVGLDEPKRKLVDLIMMEHVEQEVILVVGMGGLGKTTLVREVFGCQELRDKFKCFALVTVLHPFNMEEFIESMAKQILFDKRSMLLPKPTIKEKVIGYLEDNRCLIVLDDLSSASEWDKIKDVLPTGNRSRIIITTRLRPLAESISHQSENIYEVKELSKNNAFDLFFKAVYKIPNYRLMETKDPSWFNIIYGSSSTKITKTNREVQKQCITINVTKDMKIQASLIIESSGRLPLAIVTIGNYLATKPKTSVEWKKMHDLLSSELANNPDLGVVGTVLTSSYDGMPHHLKPSLLYLSVFHNHKEIRRSRIIRRWMADGYVMEGRKKTAEEVGKGYFNDLMGRNLIQPSQTNTIVNGDVKRCNIHDMMYELIFGKAINENMVSLLEDQNLTTMTDKVRHLVIARGPCTGGKVITRMKLSHMRSVSMFGEVGDYLRYIPRMKLVRVLDLEGTLDLHNRDLRNLGKLRHLKYLGLRGTKITELPDSLEKLSELETLDIRNTAVDRLPTGLSKLQNLSYLRAGFDFHNNPDIELVGLANYIILKCVKNFGLYGVRAPRGISELGFLKILGMINIGRSNALANELQNLTNLRKLAVTGFTRKNGKTLAKVIDGLKHLKSLVLSAGNDPRDDSGLQCCLGSVSSPPMYLQSLKLYSPLGELPEWISSLENLGKIHFRYTFLPTEIKAIGKLHNLLVLYMSHKSLVGGTELCFDKGTFPMLQVMILEGLEKLEYVSIKETALERLELLKISKCWSIKNNGVLGLKYLVQLKEMEVVVSESESDQDFVSYLQLKLLKHPKKPILRVYKD